MMSRLLYFMLGILIGFFLGQTLSSKAGRQSASVLYETPPRVPKPAVKKDALTEIKGIGPAYEKQLNAMGIMNFAQLAQQNPDELASKLPRLAVDRADDWIAQAKARSER